MSWNNRPVLALLTVGLFLLLGLGLSASLPGLPDPPRPVSGPLVYPTTMDQNANQIADDLELAVREAAASEAIPVVVQTDHPVTPAEVGQLAGRPVQLRHLYRHLPGFAADLTPDQIESLARQSWVRRIEPDRPVTIQMETASRDFGVQQGRVDFGADGDGDGNPGSYSRDDVVIAVVDTGIDAAHTDLAGKVLGWHDWIHGRPDPYDDHGHGTHVAGIAAGAGRGDSRYAGVAPGAALVGLKVLDARGSGSLSNVAAAVDWCIEHRQAYNIRIISMSLGTAGASDGTDLVSQAVNRAAEAGMVVVVAAGNSGPNPRSIGSPGAAAGAITVGAMADTGERGFHLAHFSSRGPTLDGRIKPEIAAPGVMISAPRAGTGSGYVSFSGTSMATPFVSGTVALMLDVRPDLTDGQVRQILRETAQEWGAAGQDPDYGWGRLDAYAAIRSAAGGGGGPGPALPVHQIFRGELTAARETADHLVTVADTQFPLAATLIMPGWTGRQSPDFDLYLFDPAGTEIGRSTGVNRQETLTIIPPRPGDYRLRVLAYAGRGEYALDVSAGGAAGGRPDPDQPPVVAVVQPAEGAQVSGLVRVRVQAADDVGVSLVELAIDQGEWIDMTDRQEGGHHLFDWQTENVVNGPHTLRARVVDTAGQTATVQRLVHVVNTGWRHDKQATGQVGPNARDAWVDVEVAAAGELDLTLSWSGTADLDFFVYGPESQFLGQAFTLRNPETLRVSTEAAGPGLYRVKVNLYRGSQTGFTLTARGLARTTYLGSVSRQQRDATHQHSVPVAGPGRFVLTWEGSADLDLYVYDPDGTLRGRAFTLRNPERLVLSLGVAGHWPVRVNHYAGPATPYTLQVYAPARILR